MGLFLYSWINYFPLFFFFGLFSLSIKSLDQYSRDEKEWREGPVYDCSALEASLLLNEQTYELFGA